MPIHVKIIISLALGVLVGVLLNRFWTPEVWASLGIKDKAAFPASGEADGNQPTWAAHAAKFAIDANRFIGRLFIRCLQFIAVPIVLFSLIAAQASLGDVRKLGRIGGKTLLTFMVTTAIAIVVGIGLSQAVKPGSYVGEESKSRLMSQYAAEAGKKASEGQERARTMTASMGFCRCSFVQLRIACWIMCVPVPGQHGARSV
jgi:Na+/H+-dicarboxylate symporter